MKISELQERKIVTKDGHFMPLVFVDTAIWANMLYSTTLDGLYDGYRILYWRAI